MELIRSAIHNKRDANDRTLAGGRLREAVFIQRCDLDPVYMSNWDQVFRKQNGSRYGKCL